MTHVGIYISFTWAFALSVLTIRQCEGLEGEMGKVRIPRLNQYVFCKYL